MGIRSNARQLWIGIKQWDIQNELKTKSEELLKKLRKKSWKNMTSTTLRKMKQSWATIGGKAVDKADAEWQASFDEKQERHGAGEQFPDRFDPRRRMPRADSEMEELKSKREFQ